jgi:ectoine hydroxylase-related dioxygenase (phytanoyl-CoA dioxygenase family)
MQIYTQNIFQNQKVELILFDGRIIHRGLSNKSTMTRYAIYISYYKKSYIDEESILPYLQKIEK